MVSLDFALKSLLDVIKSERDVYPIFLTPFEREQMRKTCIAIKSDKNFNFQLANLHKGLCKQSQPPFPLEYLWMLHMFRILPLEYYLLEISNYPNQLLSFAENVTSLYFTYVSVSETAKDVLLSGFLSYLINGAFISVLDVSQKNDKLEEVCSYVLDIVLNGVFTCKREISDNKSSFTFLLLGKCGILEQSSLQLFYRLSLQKFLQLKPTVTIMGAFKLLQNEKLADDQENFQYSIKFIGAMDHVEVANILKEHFKKDDTNWESLMTVLSVFQNVHQNGISQVSELVTELLKESFQDNNERLLLIAFLVGRHTVYQESSNSSETYRIWFQKNFGDSINSYAKTSKSFCLLMQVLSNIVPIENLENLKVPLECEPFIPSECRAFYQKYTSLSKVRIKELKPVAHPEAILEKVLASFQQTKKIPLSILEASLLQKQQFHNEFLKVLLTPRVLPSIPDTKMRFIEALKREGKIPLLVFQQYEEACQREANC